MGGSDVTVNQSDIRPNIDTFASQQQTGTPLKKAQMSFQTPILFSPSFPYATIC